MILEIGSSTFFGVLWSLGYLFLKERWDLEAEWSCRAITAIHALLVTFLAAFAWYLGPSPFTEPGGPNTYCQMVTLTISLGYFFFDFSWCLMYQTEGATMMLHHMCSIVAISQVLVNGVSGTEATAGLFCLEITNPFLQARWMLRSAGYKDTLIHTLVELLFMILFIFFRLIWGSYLCYKTILHPKPSLEAKLAAATFYLLSWVFMSHIASYFCKKYFTIKKVPRSSVTKESKPVHGNDSDVHDSVEGKKEL